VLKVHTKKDLDYEAHSSLLYSTASDYDSKHGVSKGKRQVYAHEVDHNDEDVDNAHGIYRAVLLPLCTVFDCSHFHISFVV
jgi:hypothetical protein